MITSNFKKLKLGIGIILMFSVFCISTIKVFAESSNLLVMLVNSPRVQYNGIFDLIDKSNTNICAVVKNGRTLIPVRFLAETFKAKVSYDPVKSEVSIELENGTKALIPIGKTTMYIGEKSITLDVPAQVIEGRTLLPIRKLSEDLFGKKVFYKNGVIIIADNNDLINENNTDELINKFKTSLDVSAKPIFKQFSKPSKGSVIAIMKTNMGNIKIRLFPEIAPKAVDNFIKHSQNNYYDGLLFHRVIKDFMIQGGDPKGDGTGGESIWGEPFKDEFSQKLGNYRGALSMANSGPDTNGSQFFIVQNQNVPDELAAQMQKAGFPEYKINLYQKPGGAPWLDFRHTVFGQIFEGMDIVDNIASVETDKYDKPKSNVIIQDIEISEK